MKKKTGAQVLSMRTYFEQQASTDTIPASCKVLYKFDERSGLPVNSVTGHAYDPANLVVPGVASTASVGYSLTNAVQFISDESSRTVIANFNATFNTRKVIILACVIKSVLASDGTANTRATMGTAGNTTTGDSAALSVSFSGGMHTRIETAATGGEIVSIAIDTTRDIRDFTNPKIIYVLWNGLGSSASVNGTLTAKVLNLDSSVYIDTVSSNACSQTVAGLITADTFTPGNMMRPDGYYYKMEAWELDYLPLNIDLQLATWGSIAVAGFKGAIILK